MKYIYIVLILLILIVGCSAETKTTKEPLKDLKKIEIKGSDTLLQLASNLAEAYTKEDSDAKISVTGGGSGTGIAALINGEVDIADSSRPIKEKEVEIAGERGIVPTEFIVARDMLSVIVHEDNPMSELTVDQLSKIFKGDISNWKEIDGKEQEITLYGRQSTSGTYVFFMDEIVRADYSPYMRNMEGNQAILEAVKQDKTAIGYIGIGYIFDQNNEPVNGIKVIKVAKNKNTEYISPLDKSRLFEYPISRPLFQYIAKKPAKGSSLHNFLLFEQSDKGQEIVEKTGFVQITSADRRHNGELLS